MGDPELFFAGLVYPVDEVEVIKEGGSFTKVIAVDARFKNPERYSCPLELQDGDRQADVMMLHTWSINKAVAQDPTLRTLTELANGTSAVAKVVQETDPVAALKLTVAPVTRATATRHYIVNRTSRDRVEPIAVITVIPHVSVTNHIVASNMPFRIAAPFIYAQLAGTRVIGDSIIRRNPNNELFHWRQYRRPDPDAMEAGLRFLNAALVKLVALARSKGSLIRALGEPDPVLKGPLGEQLTAVLLGADYGDNPSGDVGQILLLAGKPYNTTDPLSALFRFDVFDSWESVHKRVIASLSTANRDASEAVASLARDMYLSILTTYTGATALREQGERVRANGFTVKKASSSTAGVHHCSLVDTSTDAVSKLRLRLGKVIPPEMIREYSLVAVFNVDVVGNPSGTERGDSSAKFAPVTRIEYVNIDPSADFSRHLRVLPQTVPESYASSSRGSKITWHATSLPQLVDTHRLVATPSTLTFDVLWPLTIASANSGDIKTFGAPFADTGSARVPLSIPTNNLLAYANAKNGGNPSKHVQILLLAFLEEPTDPLGLGNNGVAYETFRRSGDFANPAAPPIAGMLVGVHSDPFVSRPIVGVTLVDIGLPTLRISADDAVEAARAQYNLPDSVATRVRHSLAAINSNKDAYEQRIKDVLRYRIQCVSYVQKVLLDSPAAAADPTRAKLIGNLFDALADTQLERPAGEKRPGILVWSATQMYPPFPNSIENLALLADRSKESMARRAAMLTWLERFVNEYGSGKSLEELALATWRADRDGMVADFLGEASNYSVCVAMVDEREAVEAAREELARFSDGTHLLSTLGNVVSVFNSTGVSPSMDRAGVILDVIGTEAQAPSEPDDDYSYRLQVARELTENITRVDSIRARFIRNDRIGSELPLGVVKENADAILSNPSLYPVSAADKKRLERVFKVNPPKDSVIVRQAYRSLSDNLKTYLEGRLSHAGALAAINSSKPVPKKSAGASPTSQGLGKSSRSSGGPKQQKRQGSPSYPGIPSSALVAPSSPVTSLNLPKLQGLADDVYDAAKTAQDEAVKSIQAASKRVTEALEIEKSFIEFMRIVSAPGNVIIDHLVAQTDIFSVSQSRAFTEMVAPTYEISAASGAATRPTLNVSEPVYTAVRQFLSLKKSNAAAQPNSIVASTVRIISEKEGELSSLYSVQVSLDSNNLVIKRLADLIDAILTAGYDTTFDLLFNNPAIPSGYAAFYTKVRVPVRSFSTEIAMVQQRFEAAVSETASLIAVLNTLGANAPAALVDEGIKMVDRFISPQNGFIKRTAEVAQNFARVIKKIVDDTNTYVLNSNLGVAKKPSVLMANIRSGFVTRRDADYATIKALLDERSQLVQRSMDAEQDVKRFRAKVNDIVARSSGQPLSAQTSELIAAVESHKNHFGTPTPAMVETYTKFTTTLDKSLVKYFLLDAWTSPEALEEIRASYEARPPRADSEADQAIVWTVMRRPDQLAKLRAAYTSKLTLLANRVVDNAVGQIPLGTVDTVRANFADACTTATSNYFDALANIPRDAISRGIKARLYRSVDLVRDFPTPAAMESMITTELHPELTRVFAQEGRRLMGEYFDRLRIASTLALNTTLLWGNSNARVSSGVGTSYIIPLQEALGRLLGWKTGALNALEAQMQGNLPMSTLDSAAVLSFVNAAVREQNANERLPMPFLVYHAIQRGYINVDRYIGASDEGKALSQAHYATLKAVFAIYCRLTLSAVESSARSTLEETETLLGVSTSRPTEADKITITTLIRNWLDDGDSVDLMPAVHEKPEEVAKEIHSLFDNAFNTKMEAHLGGSTLARLRKRYGWTGALEKARISEKDAEAQLRSQAIAFCRDVVFSPAANDGLFYAVLDMFGVPANDAVTYTTDYAQLASDTFNLLAADLTARSSFYAGRSDATNLWNTLSAPDVFGYKLNALVPTATAPAAAAAMILATYRDDLGGPQEAVSIMAHWRDQVDRLTGRIQAMGDAIKDIELAKVGKTVDQVAKDKVEESVQRMVDSAVSQIRTRLLVDTTEDYQSAERAYERLISFYPVAQQLAATFTARFTSAASKVGDHLSKATQVVANVAPVSTSVPPKRVQR